MTSFYTDDELKEIGFKSIGRNVLLSRKTSIYGADKISIGNNVRIDDFCILSGNIVIGSHIHISAYVALYGAEGIELEDYTGISPRSTIYSAMDDFSGDFLIGPIHPKELTNVSGGRVIMKKFSHVGANCIIFPNIVLSEGSMIGAMSLVNRSTKEWSINVGIPAKFIKKRSNKLLEKLE